MALYKYYHKKNIWLTGFIVWTLFILVVTVIPASNEVITQKTVNFRWDYLEHFLAYFIFGSLYIMWRGDSNYSIKGMEGLIMFTVACAFALSTEFLQLLIPGRAYNIFDFIYNLAGVLCSIFFVYFYLVRYYLKKKHSRLAI